MHETDTPTNVGSNDGLGLAQDRAAFECLVVQLTGRDMAYHDRNGTTGLDTAWLCYRAGVAAERERWAGVEEYLMAAADVSMSRNNSENLAAELLAQIRGPNV